MGRKTRWTTAAILGLCASCSGQEADRAYLSANGLLNRGMYELAAAEYEAFLAGSPEAAKGVIARYGLSVCRMRLKDYDRAAPILRALAAEEFDYSGEAGLLLAQCELALGRFGAAGDAAEAAVRDHPESAAADDAAVVLAEARYREGAFQGAMQAAEVVERRWPRSAGAPRAALIGGLAAAALGMDAEAATRLEALADSENGAEVAAAALLAAAQSRHRLGETRAARAMYERVVAGETTPQTPEALVGLGALQREAGELDAAGRTLDRVGREFAGALCAPRALLERGRVWLERGDAPRAARSVEAAEAAGLAGDEAAFWLARCEVSGGDPAGAAGRLARAIEAFPASGLGAEMRFDRAAALVRAGDDAAASRALAEFEAAYEEHPLLTGALEMHARAEHRQGRYDQSLTLCRKFLEAGSERADEVEFLAGENMLLGGDTEGAVAAYARVLKSSEDADLSGRAAFRLGTVLYGLGRTEEAVPLLERVAEAGQIPPEFRAVLLCLGDAGFQEGEWAKAEGYLGEYLKESWANGPADSTGDARLKFGVCAARLDRPAEALSRLDALLREKPVKEIASIARYERGRALLALGRTADAAEAFRSVDEGEADSAVASAAESQLGAMALAAGDGEAAAAHFARAGETASDSEAATQAAFGRGQGLLAGGRYDEAADEFGRVMNAPGAHGTGRAKAAAGQRVVALRRGGRADEAAAAFDEYRGLPGTLDEAVAAGVEYELARALRELGRTDESAAALRRLLEAPGPIAAYAMLDLASIESEAGRDTEATALLTRAAALMTEADIDTGDLADQIAYRLAASRFREGRYAAAAGTLDALVDGEPSEPLRTMSRRLRAQARMAQGSAAAAAADYEILAREAGEADDLLGWGEALAAAHDWDGSERALEVYLERHEDGAMWFRARFGLGWALENQGRHEEAMAEYARVTAGHEGPTAARAQFQMGECLFAMGRHADAARELMKVDILYAYPEWSAAGLYEAGRCLALLGREADAGAQFAAVLERYPQTEWAVLAAKELRKSEGAGAVRPR